jgi:hypothetical protein
MEGAAEMTSAERPVECERLAEALRGLRARTGLSLAALARKTPYSKSSWERYLNAKTVPPRAAVEELCELAGAEPGRPLALWELADAAWSGRAAAGVSLPPPAAVPTSSVDLGSPPGAAVKSRAWQLRSRAIPLGAAVAALAAVAVSVVLVTNGAFGAAGPHTQGAPSAPAVSLTKGCTGSGCTGKDPETYGCGVDPVPATLREHRFPGGTVVKIRHGVRCGAVWARVDLGNVGDRVEILAPGRSPQRAEVADEYDAQRSLSTPMTAVSRHDLDGVRACLLRDGERHCFPSRQLTSDGSRR